MRTCSIEGCEGQHYCRGWCELHYNRWKRHGDPLAYMRAIPGICAVDGCEQKTKALGYCNQHYQRLKRNGDPLKTRHNYTGNGFINQQGYRVISAPGHPNAGKYGRVTEHRKVMADMLGRPLYPDEVVHHKNGVRDDNRPENLELWLRTHPDGTSMEDAVRWAREILRRYDHLVSRGEA